MYQPAFYEFFALSGEQMTMYKKKLLCAATSLFMMASVQARAQGDESYQPSKIDLSKLVQCGYTMQDMFNFGYNVVNAEAEEKKLNLRKVSAPDFYMTIYELKQPISAFGFQSKLIAFEGLQALAVLDTPTAAELAKRLSLAQNKEETYGTMFSKVVSTEPSRVPGTTVITKALVVMDKPDQPGKTFVGCDYDYAE